MPAVASVADLVQALRLHRLLEPERLDQLAPWAAKFRDPKALAKDLVQRGWLTPYQVNQLVQGKAAELGLGNYVLLERLGEGGMGQVFKARHRAMGRVVALKVMRKELTSKADVVRRFRREIMMAASLHHPNIVLAFDADQVGDTHFFAMEYVEGIDLGRLVKSRGPMVVRDACDAIRQAAMGLQHAFEHSLVHRDIKPTNLLLSRGTVGGAAAARAARDPSITNHRSPLASNQVVKILDMGLARLQEMEDDSNSNHAGPGGPAVKGTEITQTGKVMGTPDFIAPEQARNSHSVDIRADLYSLGCTFHYILTGKVPFQGGSMIEKLFRHQTETAAPVEQLRPDIPPAVGAIIRKLMAKRPDDRFQIPAELAAALIGLTIPAHLQQAAAMTMVGHRNATPTVGYDVPTAMPVAQPVNAAVPTAMPVVASAVLNGTAPAFRPAPKDANRPAPRSRRKSRWARLIPLVVALLLFGIGAIVYTFLGNSWSSHVPSSRKAVSTPQRPAVKNTARP